MSAKQINAIIERTGSVYATLFNAFNESLFLGKVYNSNTRKGRLHMTWKLPESAHVSPFTAFMIHTDTKVLHQETILPVRADMGLKKFEVEIDG